MIYLRSSQAIQYIKGEIIMNIQKFDTVSSTELASFNRKLETAINAMQKSLLKVEIQYSTTAKDNTFNDVVYSALIIGRA